MNNIKSFDDFNKVNEEFNIFPTNIDIIRKKLSFLIDKNLDSLKSSINQQEVKDIMLKVDKVFNTKKTSLSDIIKDADVHLIQNMLDVLREIQSNLNDKEKNIGQLTYLDDMKKFSYNPGFDI
jgi:DNA-directed RNA polymerase specialized sigma subunit